MVKDNIISIFFMLFVSLFISVCRTDKVVGIHRTDKGNTKNEASRMLYEYLTQCEIKYDENYITTTLRFIY